MWGAVAVVAVRAGAIVARVARARRGCGRVPPWLWLWRAVVVVVVAVAVVGVAAVVAVVCECVQLLRLFRRLMRAAARYGVVRCVTQCDT